MGCEPGRSWEEWAETEHRNWVCGCECGELFFFGLRLLCVEVNASHGKI